MLSPVDRGSLAPAQLPPAEPTPVQPGRSDYYLQRVADFEARNPGMQPPDYYLGYGDKYMQRFETLDRTDLSADGLAWRDKTTLALQHAIEDFRIRDPDGFAAMERDPQAFREFAFGTHPDAYVDSGLYDLPAQDLLVIATTPDIGDVLSSEGIDQTLLTIGKLKLEDLPEMAGDTFHQYLRDAGPMPFTATGAGTAIATEGRRLFERFSAQDSPFPLGIPVSSMPVLSGAADSIADVVSHPLDAMASLIP